MRNEMRTTIGDVIATTEAGQKLIAEVKTDRAEKARKQEEVRAMAKAKADDLKALALSLADTVGCRWPRMIRDDRWQALAWGNMVDRLSMYLRHAAHDTQAYQMAFEAIYGEPLRNAPPAAVYRNEKAVRQMRDPVLG